MNEFDLPIFKKVYDLYKVFHSYRKTVPKQDRHTLWQRADIIILDLLEILITAINLPKNHKLPFLEKASSKLTIIRILFRLSYETKVIDNRRYLTLQEYINEIGKMLGGWIKASRAV